MAPGKRHVVLTVDSVDRGLGFNKSTSGFGPELRFKLGETVTIDVVNNLANVGTSVHWHGQDLGRDVWADGAQGLTQRSIDPVESASASNVFRYRFVAGPAGTGWYHAHDGSQLMAGLRGALIVEDDKANEKSRDNEHVLMIWDQLPENITGSLALSLLEEFGMGIPPEKWKNAAEPATMPGMSSMDHAMHGTMPGMPMPTTSPTAKLGTTMPGMSPMDHAMHGTIPGMPMPTTSPTAKLGMSPTAQKCPPNARKFVPPSDLSDAPLAALLTNGRGYSTTTRKGAPFVINVRQHETHLFRAINGGSNWAVWFGGIDGHANLTRLVAWGHSQVEPIDVPFGVVFTPGERIDLSIVADAAIANYWVRLATLDGRGSPAVLHYEGAPEPLTDPNLGEPPLVVPFECGRVPFDLSSVEALKTVKRRKGKGSMPLPPTEDADKTLLLYATDNAMMPVPKRGGAADVLSAGGFNVSVTGGGDGRACNPRGQGMSMAAGTREQGASGEPAAIIPPESRYCWGLNWNLFEMPKNPPMFYDVDKVSSLRTGDTDRSFHVNVPLGSIVDIVVINPSTMTHPFHLHAGGFWVVAAGSSTGGPPLRADGSVDYKALSSANDDAAGKSFVSEDPIYLDTYSVPPVASENEGEGAISGTVPIPAWAVMRFVARNAGIVAFHCHLDLHAETGIFMFFRVTGTDIRAPWYLPPGLSTCGTNSKLAVSASTEPEFHATSISSFARLPGMLLALLLTWLLAAAF
jgi:hypothetical protein